MPPVTRMSIAAIALALLSTPNAHAADHVDFSLVIVDPSAPRNPYVKTVGDVNGDGYVDALVGSARNEGMTWYGYPDWKAHSIAAGSYATDMQAADIDGDGDIDAISYQEDSGSVIWLENPRPTGDPEGSWTLHVIGADDSAHDVEIGDIDRDGKLDVVTRREFGGGTNVWIQLNPTTWQKLVVSTEDGEGTALGDIDGDGDLDIAQSGLWIETPASPRTAPTPWPDHVFDQSAAGERMGVLVADLDGNGKMDLALAPAESDSGTLRWFSSQDPKGGESSWSKHIIDSTVSYLHTFKAADMDLDGDLDLVTAEMYQSNDPDEVSVYFNHVKQGQPDNWPQQVVDSNGSHNLRVTDIDGDGDWDIFGANWNSDAPDGADVKIWRSNLHTPQLPRIALNTSHDLVTSGQKVEFRVTGDGTPNAPLALFLWRVDGQLQPHALLIGSLDSTSNLKVSFTVPPIPSSVALSFQSFALVSAKVDPSNERTVDFH